jgi:fermentation-respiration switch protein FrsA (DUF1100 family)
MASLRLRHLLLVAAFALLGFVAVSMFFAWHFTGPIRRPVGQIPQQLAGIAASVSFLARDGTRLSGWFLPSGNANTGVILLHGHGSNRRQMIARAQFLHGSGFAVLLYDARGQGLSEGDKVSAGWYETADLLGAIDYFQSIGFSRIGCIGASQGGATIALTGARLPQAVKWVILEGTYPTMRDAIDRRFRLEFKLPSWLAGALFLPLAERRLHLSIDDIAPIKHIQELPCPVFVISGEIDRDTLAESTRALFAAAKEPKELWIVPGAAHVDIYGFAKAEYEKRILGFISRAQAIR